MGLTDVADLLFSFIGGLKKEDYLKKIEGLKHSNSFYHRTRYFCKPYSVDFMFNERLRLLEKNYARDLYIELVKLEENNVLSSDEITDCKSVIDRVLE